MLVVVARDDAPAALSFRNIPEVQLIIPGELNAYDVLCNDWIVFTENTLPTATPTTSSPAAASEPEVDDEIADEPAAEAVEDEAVEAVDDADDTVDDVEAARSTKRDDTVDDRRWRDEA